MLWSALLIHLLGGRIEAHFHVFGSLAFLAFYRDWKVLITATIVVAADHMFRGIFYPQSVFGVLEASNWRWLEHAAWVTFEDVILVTSCLRGVEEMRDISDRQARVDVAQELTEAEIQARTEDLRHAVDAAVAANKTKSEFLANMSHEIRTPMNGVIGMTELLKCTYLSDEQQDLLATLQESSESLLSIINDILDISKIEAGRIQFEANDLDLKRLLEEVASSHRLAAEAKGLKFTVEIPPSVPLLKGDAKRLKQVLTNLVGNAIKFTSSGAVTLQLRQLDSNSDKASFVIEVTDTGLGISNDRLGVIFESLTQADGSSTRQFGGAGLGLSISKQLTEAMGGTITVESREGVGSTFSVSLPFPLSKANPALNSVSAQPSAESSVLRNEDAA